MSSRLLKKALAASNQLSEGYSPWAKYKLKNPTSPARRDLSEDEEDDVVLLDDEPGAGAGAEGAGKRGAGAGAERAAEERPRRVSTGTGKAEGYSTDNDDSTVLDDDDLDVTIPLSDTFPHLRSPRRAAAPSDVGAEEGFLGLEADLLQGIHDDEERDDPTLRVKSKAEPNDRIRQVEKEEEGKEDKNEGKSAGKKRQREDEEEEEETTDDGGQRKGRAEGIPAKRHKKTHQDEAADGAGERGKVNDTNKGKRKRTKKQEKDEEEQQVVVVEEKKKEEEEEEQVGEPSDEGAGTKRRRQRKAESAGKGRAKSAGRESKAGKGGKKAAKTTKRRGKAVDSGDSDDDEARETVVAQEDEKEQDSTTKKRKAPSKKGKATTKLEATAGPRKVICISGLPLEERDLLVDVALNLGNATVERANIPETMTHVVVGDKKRTMKVLFALGMGCFIVKPDWLWQSLSAGKWLPEDEFEAVDWFPGARRARTTAVAGKCDLLSEKVVYVKPAGNKVSAQDLRHLVAICRGKVTNKRARADYIISAKPEVEQEKNPSVKVVREEWLLDSLQHCQLMDPADYEPSAQGDSSEQKTKRKKPSAAEEEEEASANEKKRV